MTLALISSRFSRLSKTIQEKITTSSSVAWTARGNEVSSP